MPETADARRMSDRTTTAIAKKEFLEYTRRPWILVLSGLLVLLMLGTSYFISTVRGAEGGFGGFVLTITIIRSVVALIVPVIAIIMAHSALAGEQESGSLSLLLAQPLARREVVLGKFLGLFAVLAGALLVAFGLSGLVIGLRAENPEWGDFGRFVVATLLYTAAYFGLFFAISALATRRTPALLGALGIWAFFGVVYDTLLLLLVFRFGDASTLGTGGLPGWMTALQLLSIPDTYSNLMFASSTALKNAALSQGGGALQLGFLGEPWAAAVLTLALVAWVVVSLLVAIWAVDRKDV